MIDSHVHIDADVYFESPGGVRNVLESAAGVGVDRVVAPALHLESYQKLQQLRAEHPEIFPAVGIHPHECSPERTLNLAYQLEHHLATADQPILGETGLEGHYDFTPMDIQIESLRQHLQVASVHSVPVILHCRDAESLLFEQLNKYNLPAGGVVHCFTGTWDWARRFLDLGFHIGITGIVTFKNASQVHEVAGKVPLERLLVETDGPYLAPMPYRGKTNKPEYIPHIVDKIADLRGVCSKELGEQTAANTEKLFGLLNQGNKILPRV